MGVELIESFGNRYYIDELRSCRLLNIKPLELDVIRIRNKRLNKSNFKSELWFIEYLKTIDMNFKCYRNYPILNRFFADFYIKEIKTVIEIDGKSHDISQEYDLMRDKLFNSKDIKVIRIKYQDEDEAKKTCDYLINKLSDKKSSNSNNKKSKKVKPVYFKKNSSFSRLNWKKSWF